MCVSRGGLCAARWGVWRTEPPLSEFEKEAPASAAHFGRLGCWCALNSSPAGNSRAHCPCALQPLAEAVEGVAKRGPTRGGSAQARNRIVLSFPLGSSSNEHVLTTSKYSRSLRNETGVRLKLETQTAAGVCCSALASVPGRTCRSAATSRGRAA